jgi:NADPH2:quinone reductase
MRAVQISRFGGSEVMDADLPDPVPGDGERLVDLSSSGVTFADAHHRLVAGLTWRLQGPADPAGPPTGIHLQAGRVLASRW